MKNQIKLFLFGLFGILVLATSIISCNHSTNTTDPIYYTVSFDSDGGTEVSSQSVESGKTAVEPEAPTKAGYTFTAWYNGDSVFDFSTPIESDITLKAIWSKNSFTIAYKSENYGTIPDSIKNGISLEENSILTEEQIPSLSDENAIFKGWYDGDTKVVAGEYKVTKNVTLTALWDDEANVSYSSVFGKVPTSFTAKRNQTLTEKKLTAIESSTYTFMGWFYSKDETNNGTGTQAKVDDKITADTTLYAKWKTSTITFETQFGEASSIKKYTGEKLEESEITSLSETGYTFSGWYNDSTQLTTDYSVTADVTFTAKWTANTYTVTFNSNGGTGSDTTQDFSFGTSKALTQNTFTKTGYTFIGWATEQNSAQVEYSDKASFLTPAENITLYAIWKANEYTITFEANNGTTQTATQTVTYGKTEKLNTNPFTYTAYRFTAWNTNQDGSGSSYSNGSDFAVTETNNITLYAQWIEADRFIISYANARGAENTNPTSYKISEGASLSDISLTGYIFDGWYSGSDTNGNGTGTKITSWGANAKSEDITLHAKWSPRTDTAYKVEHYKENADDNGFTIVEDDTENLTGTTDSATSAEAKSYTNFTAQSFSQESIAPDGTTVVKIYYKRDNVTMSFNLAGGKIGEDESATLTGKYASSFTITSPAKQGYTFASWNPSLPDSMESGTYTAIYTPNTNTSYKVYHYQQNANDDHYTLKDTDNLTGTTATQTNAVAKSYEHFTAGTVTQAAIAADGSTEIRINYDRETVTFTLNLASGTLADETGTISKTGKYGQTVNITAPTRTNYSFNGWNTTGGTLPATYETDGNYTAVWSAIKGISVQVQIEDIIVTKTQTGNTYTFSAETCDSYSWTLDDVEIATTQTCNIDISTFAKDTYILALEAKKGSKWYSYYAQIKVTE